MLRDSMQYIWLSKCERVRNVFVSMLIQCNVLKVEISRIPKHIYMSIIQH